MTNQNTKIVYELDESTFHEALKNGLANVAYEQLLSRFRGKLISSKTVAELHGVTPETVTRAAAAGKIPHIREGKLYKFEIPDALEIDFHKMRSESQLKAIRERLHQIHSK